MELLELRVPFNRRSERIAAAGKEWEEIIRPSAFVRTVNSGADVESCWIHRTGTELGRRSRGTLRLRIEPDALVAVVTLDPAQHRGFIESARSGVLGASFTFKTPEGGDRWCRCPDGRLLRELVDVDLEEVAPVPWAAYPAATARLLVGERRAAYEQEERERRLRKLEERERLIRGPGTPLAIRRRRLDAMTARLRLLAAA